MPKVAELHPRVELEIIAHKDEVPDQPMTGEKKPWNKLQVHRIDVGMGKEFRSWTEKPAV